MKTSIYVDGFNFYYGCFKYQRHRCSPADKWLNWRYLANHLAGDDHQAHKVHYFVAHVHRSDHDPDQNIRQQLYFRALATIPSIELHFGKHIPVTRLGRLITPNPGSLGVPLDTLVKIRTFEEKGSDVNLAVRLVDDAWSGEIERAIIVSNDTDLISAIRSARRHIRVDVVSPQESLATALRKAASYAWMLDLSLLRRCRMAVPVIARDGAELYPPQSWRRESWPAPTIDVAEGEV